MLKYGSDKFILEIIEYCVALYLLNREQYYIDRLNPEYYILKQAGSVSGFKHSDLSLKLISAFKLGRPRTDVARLSIALGSAQASAVFVIDNESGQVKHFSSIRKSADFFGINHTYIAKGLKTRGIYEG